jgi:trans-aconitate 2-methyltransferase
MQNYIEKKSLSDSHKWNGKEYRKISFPQFNINSKFLNTQLFKGNEIVLDIGCGDGTTTKKILEKVPFGSVLGIDACINMVETANEFQIPDILSFKILNAHDINFSQQFNLVTCFFCMQWVQDKPKVFKKIFQSLKANGRLLMIVPLPHAQLAKIRHELISSHPWSNYFKNYKDPLRYINNMHYKCYSEEAGLIVSEYQNHITPIRFQKKGDFFAFMQQMTPHCSYLPNEALKKTFMQSLLNSYLNIYPMAEDGSCELAFDLVKLIAFRS